MKCYEKNKHKKKLHNKKEPNLLKGSVLMIAEENIGSIPNFV